MTTVHVLPIEPFNERYTGQWFMWWPKELRAEGFNVNVICGENVGERRQGEFLDPTLTWIWKGIQVSNLAKCWGSINTGDWILNLDGWGPASTAAVYMKHTTNKDVKIALFMHAGSYDPHDFLARTGCRQWALDVERGWVKAADLLLLGSHFHEQLIKDNLGMSSVRASVCGVPIHKEDILQMAAPVAWEKRARLVIFPHRLAPEKAPEEFNTICDIHKRLYPQSHSSTVWLRTRDLYTNKRSYYNLLAQARCAISTARQETFGIAMQEAAVLGSWLIVPNRLSYPETVRGAGWLYNSLEEAASLVERALNKHVPAPWDGYHEHAIKRAAQALRKESS